VKQWKFQGDHALGFRLGELMGITYNHLLCGNVVSYVPRYGESYPYFGNHLFSFLAGLQKTGNCAVVPAYVKTRATMPQKTLSRSARMVNLHDAFVPTGTCADIVVDDVMTTGLRVEFCISARRLKYGWCWLEWSWICLQIFVRHDILS